jgi:hypothetical protein
MLGVYLEAELLSSVEQRLKPGMSRLFADPQARPSMTGIVVPYVRNDFYPWGKIAIFNDFYSYNDF